MNTRKISTYVVIVLTILLANLLESFIMLWVPDLEKLPNPYQATAIRMAIMVIVFTPLFAFLDTYVQSAAKVYVKTSKKVAGGSFYGLWIGATVALLLMFTAFLYIWYRINWVGRWI
jgi:hypothetical protein